MNDTAVSQKLSSSLAARRNAIFPSSDAIVAQTPHTFGILWVLAVFLLVFLGIGLTFVILQHYRLATYVPVQAEIVSAAIRESHSHSRHGDSTTYAPEISYRYSVNGNPYIGSRVLAMGEVSSSLSWARQFLNRYPVGSTATAYVSPSDPASSFLDREVECFPYILALFPGLFYAFLIGGAASGQRRSNRAAVASGQWQTLHPSQPPNLIFRKALITATLWLGYVLILLGDYLFLTHGNIDVFAIITILCAIAAAWIGLHVPWKHYQAMRTYGPVEVSAGPGIWIPSGLVTARLSYDARNAAPLKDAAIGLVCLKSQWVQHGKNSQFQSIPMHHVEQPIMLPYSSGLCSAEVNLPIPPQIHATGREARKSYPRYDWFVGIRLHAADQPELTLRYPIQVDAAPKAMRA